MEVLPIAGASLHAKHLQLITSPGSKICWSDQKSRSVHSAIPRSISGLHSGKSLVRSFKEGGLSRGIISPTVMVFAGPTADVAVAKIGSRHSGSESGADLLETAEAAARLGAAVILEAVDKPRNIVYKGASDLVTDTDKNAELAILEEIRKRFPSHLVLGEEGGVSGDIASEYLWCVDPLDGTTNFAHAYPCFATSVGVLCRGRPVAGCVVEFSGGPGHWVTRTYTASAGGGAFCDGKPLRVSNTELVQRSLLVTGFGYEHDEAWAANIELHKHFTDVSRGVRRLGAAAVDLCHVALGIVDGYWEYRLKPWDMAAGVLIAEEAGAQVSRMDGGPFTVFDRSLLVSNGALHQQMLDQTSPKTKALMEKNFDFSYWFKPEGYATDLEE
eukprot:TRINITY_DN5260_c1_g1_i1.p1 TRINITY_DN5260_c1_g1~~TRINITY_DN5260_c1_g1_i1.p1  ORF type:complete len:404 (+),score=53.71 TRINITY_DN5260_c1_g1_i1:56-1213(+)